MASSVMYIDSHCHLTHKRLLNIGTPDQVIANAHAAGVGGMLTICCDIAEEFPQILEFSRQHRNIWCTVGTHPHDAGRAEEKNISLESLCALAQSDPTIVGIGESGLDYYYKNSPPADQIDSFRKHIRACITTGLPLVVHARDADDDIARILNEEGRGKNLRGVMHCFSSGRGLYEAALDLGFYISLSGIVTFNKSLELQQIAIDVPLDRLLLETDSPYLAPEPCRGKINEPALMINTGRFVAALRGIDESELAHATTENFFTLFDKAKLT